jgi:hypothetical protein
MERGLERFQRYPKVDKKIPILIIRMLKLKNDRVGRKMME